MSATDSESRAAEAPIEAAEASNTPKAEPQVSSPDDTKAQDVAQHDKSDAQASDSPRVIKPEIPDTEENEAMDKLGHDGGSSPASSVTSPTSTENRDMDDNDNDEDNDATSAPEQAGHSTEASTAPPLPSKRLPSTQTTTTAPLPSETLPESQDDGWEYHWNASTNSYWFYNRHTQVWQAENPRLTATPSYAPGIPVPQPAAPLLVAGQPISDPSSLSGGYNPAIHGDYDPNAWYAQAARAVEETSYDQTSAAGIIDPEYASAGLFNSRTGQWQRPEKGPERHSDEAKSKRQMNSFFDVDAAANEFEGRSLKAERAGKKPTKEELKAYKEKRRARKEEKRRAWLRD